MPQIPSLQHHFTLHTLTPPANVYLSNVAFFLPERHSRLTDDRRDPILSFPRLPLDAAPVTQHRLWPEWLNPHTDSEWPERLNTYTDTETVAREAEALHKQWPERPNHYTESGQKGRSTTQKVAREAQPPHRQWPERPNHYTESGQRGRSTTQKVAREAEAPHRHWPERPNPYTESGQRGPTPTQKVAREAEALHRKWPERLNPHTDSGHRSSSPTQWPQKLTPTPTHTHTSTYCGNRGSSLTQTVATERLNPPQTAQPPHSQESLWGPAKPDNNGLLKPPLKLHWLPL